VTYAELSQNRWTILRQIAPRGSYTKAFQRRIGSLYPDEFSAMALQLDALVESSEEEGCAPSVTDAQDFVEADEVLEEEEDAQLNVEPPPPPVELPAPEEESPSLLVDDYFSDDDDDDDAALAAPSSPAPEPLPPPSPAVAAVVADAEAYERRTVAELKEILRSRKLKLGGKKADLIQRLRDDDAATSA